MLKFKLQNMELDHKSALDIINIILKSKILLDVILDTNEHGIIVDKINI